MRKIFAKNWLELVQKYYMNSQKGVQIKLVGIYPNKFNISQMAQKTQSSNGNLKLNLHKILL